MTSNHTDGDACPHCGGEGYIMESDGDPSDWGEDTYCGPMDSTIICRHCKGIRSMTDQPETAGYAILNEAYRRAIIEIAYNRELLREALMILPARGNLRRRIMQMIAGDDK